MEKQYDYKVSVRCFTYNHASFIKDALEGFARQNTNFPVVFNIVDDASKDGEPVIIKQWAETNLDIKEGEILWHDKPYGKQAIAKLKGKPFLTFMILLLAENQYSQRISKMPYISEWNNKSQYHALCEGDDYWIDSHKLQKQVDFLDAHPDFSLCFHNAIVEYDDTPQSPRVFTNIAVNREVSVEELIKAWIVPTASMCYRSDCLPVFPVEEKIISGDWRLILHLAGSGKVWALKKVMSCYRMTYYTDSYTSKNKDNGEYMCYQKHHVLECFDKFTDFRYHSIVRKYSHYWLNYSKFTHRKKNGLVWAVLSMPGFVFYKVFHKIS